MESRRFEVDCYRHQGVIEITGLAERPVEFPAWQVIELIRKLQVAHSTWTKSHKMNELAGPENPPRRRGYLRIRR